MSENNYFKTDAPIHKKTHKAAQETTQSLIYTEARENKDCAVGLPTQEEIQKSLQKRHGRELQQKLNRAEVAICGLGGLGSHIGVFLVRAGIGHLHLIDYDRVELSNMNRQQYDIGQLGQLKTEALACNLKKINPYCSITYDSVRITEKNVEKLLKHEQIICEALDQAEEKAMLVQTIREIFPQKKLVTGIGMAGIGSGNQIKTRRVSKNWYLSGDECSDVEDGIGLVAPRVALCAAHQAHMVLRIIAGETEP